MAERNSDFSTSYDPRHSSGDARRGSVARQGTRQDVFSAQRQVSEILKPKKCQDSLRAQAEPEDYIAGAGLALYSKDIRAIGIDIGGVTDSGSRVIRIHGEANLAPHDDAPSDTGDDAASGARNPRAGRAKDWRPVSVTITPMADGSMKASDAVCDCPVGLLGRSGIWLDSQGKPHDADEGFEAAPGDFGVGADSSDSGDFGDFDDFGDFGDYDSLDASDTAGLDAGTTDGGASFGSRGARLSQTPGPVPAQARDSFGNSPDRGRSQRHPHAMLCAHAVALCELFVITPQLFWGATVRWGIHGEAPEGAARTADEKGKAAPRARAGAGRRTSPALQTAMNAAHARFVSERRQNRRNALESLPQSDEGGSGAAGRPRKKKGTKAGGMVVPVEGSVHLEPQLECSPDGWTLSMRIACGTSSYVVPDLNKLTMDFRDGRFDAYGKKLSFVHTPRMLDAYSRKVYAYLLRLRDTRLTVTDLSYRYYSTDDYVPDFGRKAHVSEPEVCDLLDLHRAHVQDDAPADGWYAPGFVTNRKSPVAVARTDAAANLPTVMAQAEDARRRRRGDRDGGVEDPTARLDAGRDEMPGSIMFQYRGGSLYTDPGRMQNAPIFEGDPAVFVTVTAAVPRHPRVVGQTGERYSDEDFGTATGVKFASRTQIKAFVRGARHSYALVKSPQTNSSMAFFRCSEEFADAAPALRALCADADEQYVAASDWTVFEESVIPMLESAGVRLTFPRLAAVDSVRVIDPNLAFYLDRDDQGITCELVAEYPDTSVQLIPRQGAIHARLSRQEAAPKRFRSVSEEEVGVSIVSRLFHEVDERGLALIDDRDEDAIMFLLRHGLTALRQAGAVYATDAFGAIEPRTPGHLRFGVSMKSHLLDVMPLADEIPSDEVASLLASFRRRRHFHRLRNGEFIDLDDKRTNKELSDFADAADALGLTDDDIAKGGAQLPASRAFVADALDGDQVEEDESFRAYVHDMDIIDPETYHVPQGLNATMRPYQLDGFRWLSTLYDKDFGGILADEMGLGKTVQTIALLLARRNDGTALVVCPASLVYNWASECSKFAPDLRVRIAAGSKAERRAIVQTLPRAAADAADSGGLGDGQGGETLQAAGPEGAGPQPQEDGALQPPELIITSYDLLRRDISDYEDARFSTVVLDEAQYIKNPEAQMTCAVKRLSAAHRFALTGTPIENRLSELWSIFDFLMPGLLRDYRWFRRRFEAPIAHAMEDGRKDAPQAMHLRAITQVFIKRRLKSQVLRDLPERLETTVKVQLEGAQRRIYAAQERRLRDMLDGDPDSLLGDMMLSVLAELTRLREICCDPRLVYDDAPASSAKLDAIADIVSSNIESGRRVLVFSQFTSFLDIIARRLDKEGIDNVKLVGSTPKKRRVEMANAFNAGEGAPVMLISLKAGNTGLNLIGASVVVHADPWWNAAVQDQATGRAHRIGQTHDVDVYQVIATDTVEERVHGMQESKSRLAHAFTTVDGSAGKMSEADARMADSGLFAGDEDMPASPSIGRMTRGDILRLLS